ncbi:helix-turn-helix domain-containing protein [Streptomyces sp. NPDC058319]|uniref:AraC-like ligand-binding domain-containing protein n=1 Tax=unclassified Streptomyces TaxID=2593676 RepID=UPI0033B22012
MERGSRVVRSTADVCETDASAYWTDAVCSAFVPVRVRPTAPAPLHGRVEHVNLDGLGFTLVRSGAQRVDRTRTLIARGGGDDVLANIQLTGEGRVGQDGRRALLAPGAMTLVDSTRPYTLEFTGPFSQLVVQVPRDRMARRSLARATAVALAPDGPARLVADFLVGLERQQRADPRAAAALVPHATGLLDCAAGWALETGPARASASALTRERVHDVLRRHAQDPRLDADTAAAACGISRRTLFRVLAEHGESFGALLRTLRVDHARRLLRAAPERTVASVAYACGFGGESQLHRAFRAVTGLTPGAYRAGAALAADGTDRQ